MLLLLIMFDNIPDCLGPFIAWALTDPVLVLKSKTLSFNIMFFPTHPVWHTSQTLINLNVQLVSKRLLRRLKNP